MDDFELERRTVYTAPVSGIGLCGECAATISKVSMTKTVIAHGTEYCEACDRPIGDAVWVERRRPWRLALDKLGLKQTRKQESRHPRGGPQ